MKDLKVSWVARRSGLSVSFVSRLMAGKRKPSVATLIKLAYKLDMSTDDVIKWLGGGKRAGNGGNKPNEK